MGATKVEVADVPDPEILNSEDALIRVTSTAICGSEDRCEKVVLTPS